MLLVLGFVLLLLATPASADVIITGCGPGATSCTLQQLLGGATIQVDDKIFQNFGAAFANLAPVIVTPIGAGTQNPGLRFDSTGWVIGASDSQPNNLAYGVVAGAGLIAGDTLSMSGVTVADGGVVSILMCCGLGSNSVQSTGPLVSTVAFAPQGSLGLATSISLFCPDEAGPNCSAELSSFSQTYTQVAVTGPGTLLLLALGLLTVASPCRRLRKPKEGVS